MPGVMLPQQGPFRMVLARLHDAYSMDASYTNSLQELTQTTFREIFAKLPVPARVAPCAMEAEA
jgi:hypothetical protein